MLRPFALWPPLKRLASPPWGEVPQFANWGGEGVRDALSVCASREIGAASSPRGGAK